MSDKPTDKPIETTEESQAVQDAEALVKKIMSGLDKIKGVKSLPTSPKKAQAAPAPQAQQASAPVEQKPPEKPAFEIFLESLREKAKTDTFLASLLPQFEAMLQEVKEGYLFDGAGEQNRIDAQSAFFLQGTRNNAYRCLGVPKGIILDVGCNKGQITRVLRDLYPDNPVWGVDNGVDNNKKPVIEEAREEAQKRLSSFLAEDIHFAFCDVGKDRLPFADGSVGAVHISLVHVHLTSEEQEHLYSELDRVMAPGATIMIREPKMKDVVDIFPKIGPHVALHSMILRTMELLGRMVNAPDFLVGDETNPGLLTRHGFVSIKHETETLPVGAGQGPVGRAYLSSTFTGPISMAKAIIGVLGGLIGVTMEDIAKLAEFDIKALAPAGSPSGWMLIHLIFAKKPELVTPDMTVASS